ncbi:MAG: sulfite oxidase [Bryobacteraceae bacterium]
MQVPSIVRREFLTRSARLALSLAAGSHVSRVWSGTKVTAWHPKLIPRSQEPPNLETPVQLLADWITPNEVFFIRCHLAPPDVRLEDWKLQVTGLVRQPVTLAMDDLKRLPEITQVVTLECAGNGRAFFNPRTEGDQWERGAVGTARWTGVRLADVIRKAGGLPAAKHVVFNGADNTGDESADFVRSLPIKKAMYPHTMLAWAMNGQTLPAVHGFPLRLIVPGWTGNHSVKWLAKIELRDGEHAGPSMLQSYRVPSGLVMPGAPVTPDETKLITALPVKSIITAPTDGSYVPPGRVRVQGAAWAGESEVAKVEVSLDNGWAWQPATLGPDTARYAWRLWHFDWKANEKGSFLLMARATDSQGRVQPTTQAWNPDGYLWNVIDQVRVNVGTSSELYFP